MKFFILLFLCSEHITNSFILTKVYVLCTYISDSIYSLSTYSFILSIHTYSSFYLPLLLLATIHSSYFTFIHTIINMFIQLQEGSKVQKDFCSLIE